MTDSRSPPAPPESIPKYISEGLPKQNDETLNAVREYVDHLLEYRQQVPEPDDLPDDADADVVKDANGKGLIVEERVKCGSDCTCNDGRGHGPYRYRYYYENGSLTSEYVGKA